MARNIPNEPSIHNHYNNSTWSSFSQFGAPETIVTNNDVQFSSVESEQFYSSMRRNHLFGPGYNPQPNGQRTIRGHIQMGSSKVTEEGYLKSTWMLF